MARILGVYENWRCRCGRLGARLKIEGPCGPVAHVKRRRKRVLRQLKAEGWAFYSSHDLVAEWGMIYREKTKRLRCACPDCRKAPSK